jgi:predicted RNA binding protein YcfA (HicA-like mRNA interferase family)
MAVYTYDEVRKVLRKIGFELIRSKKHETWERILENRTILQVRLSHQGSRTIPKGTFSAILRQMGISKETFEKLSKE